MNLSKSQIANQFSRAAGTYDEAAAMQRQMADRLIGMLPPQPTGRLVDFGCGTGYALGQLAQTTGLKLVGLDIAPGMIERAQQVCPNGPIVWKVADIEDCGLPSDHAEFAFSNAAIQWCDTESVFSEMGRVLKPGGRVLVSTFGPQTLHQWRTAWEAIGDPYPRVHVFESIPSIQAILSRNGFVDIQIDSEIQTQTFGSVSQMFQSIKKLGATNASPERSTGLLGRGTYGRLCRYFETKRKEGALTLDFECLYCFARYRRSS